MASTSMSVLGANGRMRPVKTVVMASVWHSGAARRGIDQESRSASVSFLRSVSTHNRQHIERTDHGREREELQRRGTRGHAGCREGGPAHGVPGRRSHRKSCGQRGRPTSRRPSRSSLPKTRLCRTSCTLSSPRSPPNSFLARTTGCRRGVVTGRCSASSSRRASSRCATAPSASSRSRTSTTAPSGRPRMR